jgi:hypothetical protein
MTSGRYSTSHPFTVAICTSCAAEPAERLLQMLRASIRRCPHGMLVTTGCLLGHLTCATRPSHQGALLLLQPCSTQQLRQTEHAKLRPHDVTSLVRAVNR